MTGRVRGRLDRLEERLKARRGSGRVLVILVPATEAGDSGTVERACRAAGVRPDPKDLLVVVKRFSDGAEEPVANA